MPHIDNNFQHFKVPGEKNTSIPKLMRLPQEQTGFSTLSKEHMLKQLTAYSKRALDCMEKCTSLPPNKCIEQISWSLYLLEKEISIIRDLAVDLHSPDIYCTFDYANDYLPGINAFIDNGFLKLDLPILLPKRKQNLKSAYFLLGIKHALDGLDLRNVPHTGQLCIVFIHCYKKLDALRKMRDHDNIEIKWVIDALNTFLLTEDNPLYLNHYQQSALDERNHTIIYLVPAKDIGTFLNDHYEEWAISL